MALDQAGGGGQRRSAVRNPQLVARATRTIRVLRLEHDPQPGLERLHIRAAAVSSLPMAGQAEARLYPDVLKGRRPFRLRRRSVKRTGLGRPAKCPFPLGSGLRAVAGCPNAANPDSQPSAALTYGGRR